MKLPPPCNVAPEDWDQLTWYEKVEIWLCLYHRRANQIVQRIPSPMQFSFQASLLVFVLLGQMPHHPVSMPAALGGGLSLAIIFVTLPTIVRRLLTVIFRTGAAPAEEEKSRYLLFSLLSTTGVVITFNLMTRYPQIVVLPYMIVIASTVVCGALLLFAYLRRPKLDRRRLWAAIDTFVITDLLALLFIILPSPGGIFLMAALIAADLYLAFFNIFQLFEIDLQIMQAL